VRHPLNLFGHPTEFREDGEPPSRHRQGPLRVKERRARDEHLFSALPDRRQRQPAILAPGEELIAGPRVSPARVRVADIGGKEFDIAPGGRLAGVGDQRRHQMAAVGQGRERAREDEDRGAS
jgi:hypothetical protein